MKRTTTTTSKLTACTFEERITNAAELKANPSRTRRLVREWVDAAGFVVKVEVVATY